MTQLEIETAYKMIIYETVRRICLQPMNSKSPFVIEFSNKWNFLKNDIHKNSIYHYMSPKQIREYNDFAIAKLVAASPDSINLRNYSEKIAKIIAKAVTKQIESTIKVRKEGESSYNIKELVEKSKPDVSWTIWNYKQFFEYTAILFLIANYKLVNIALTKFKQYLNQSKISEMHYLAMISE